MKWDDMKIEKVASEKEYSFAVEGYIHDHDAMVHDYDPITHLPIINFFKWCGDKRRNSKKIGFAVGIPCDGTSDEILFDVYEIKWSV